MFPVNTILLHRNSEVKLSSVLFCANIGFMKNLKKFAIVAALLLSFPCFSEIRIQGDVDFFASGIDGIPFIEPLPSVRVLYEFPHDGIFAFSAGGGLSYIFDLQISALAEFSWFLKEFEKTRLSLAVQAEGGLSPFLVINESTGYSGIGTIHASSGIMAEWSWISNRFYLRAGPCFVWRMECETLYSMNWLGLQASFGWRFGRK